jgi:hypothetical protein
MELIPLIAGFTRMEQVLYSIEQHPVEVISSLYITKYMCNTFHMPNKTFEQIRAEVSSNLSTLFGSQSHRERNFIRYQDQAHKREVFLYERIENHKVVFPSGYLVLSEPMIVPDIKPIQQVITRTKKVKSSAKSKPIEETLPTEEIAPNQTSQLCLNMFLDDLQTLPDNIEQPKIEEPTMQEEEEEEMPPLIQDIRNAEMLTEIESDKLQYLLEQMILLLPPNCPEIRFKKNAYNKMYSLTLTEEA